MKWCWVVLIVIAYFIVGTIILRLIGRKYNFDFVDDDAVTTTFTFMMWPVILTGTILFGLSEFIANCIKRLY